MKPSKQEIRQEVEKMVADSGEDFDEGEKEEIVEQIVQKFRPKNNNSKSEYSKPDRRTFLKMVGLGAGGLALSSLASAQFTKLGDDSVPTLSEVLGSGNSAGSYSVDLSGNDLEDGTTTIWDSSNGHIPSGRIQTTFGSTLSFNAPLALDASGGDRLALPGVSSDPSANAGDIWYRTDLD